ncbi:MAG TPA: SGNH/GDSL hydrolase family protein [Chloroflexia bacterium]|nr:SGNH/GDSL hydrolase family protein [Chloroflexia bacterium]
MIKTRLRSTIALLAICMAVGLCGLAPTAAAPPRSPARVGQIDSVMKDRLRRVWQAGQALGRRPNVLAKVGDSITASGSFLSDAGDGNAVLGDHKELASIIAYYRAARVDRVGGVAHNSLNRRSLAATSNWTAADLLGLRDGVPGPEPSPLQQEFAAINPSVAVILIGTNDIDHTDLAVARNNLDDVLVATLQAGIIPILSTIPDREDYPGAAVRTLPYNDTVRELAALEHVPLIDLWAAMQDLPGKGLARDRVHPSSFTGTVGRRASVTFTARGLTYGWPMRNYLTLQMLARLKRVVMDDGQPDG